MSFGSGCLIFKNATIEKIEKPTKNEKFAKEKKAQRSKKLTRPRKSQGYDLDLQE